MKGVESSFFRRAAESLVNAPIIGLMTGRFAVAREVQIVSPEPEVTLVYLLGTWDKLMPITRDDPNAQDILARGELGIEPINEVIHQLMVLDTDVLVSRFTSKD